MGKKVLAAILVIVLSLGCGLAGGYAGAMYYTKQAASTQIEQTLTQGSSANQSSTTLQIDTSGAETIAEAIAEKVMPSVVGITTVSTVETQGMSSYFGLWGFGGGGSYSYDTASIGTGVIVDEAGYILTNSHVVNDGNAKSVTVSLYDGSKVEGKVLWNDSTLDLAVVKVEAEGLVAAELGDSDQIKIGSYAAVIGNPVSLQFERSMTQGIISGLNRTIRATSSNSSSATTMEGLIQTDATINAGNSGGPLLNSRGQVIGISSARSEVGENMGFAIPINTAKPIVEQIKATGQFVRAYLGIRGVGLGEQSQYSTEQLEKEFGTSDGVYVSALIEGGGAEKAGLQEGDIILSVDGTAVNTMNKLNTILISHKVGDSVEVSYIRGGKTATVSVTLTGSSLSATIKQ
ncbi:MAG: trypsin-like peptidase domain-containing protein [Firmicutes bacterium]|nr:trypsin-like peptidase domain-containing protein [Bacillota bacterium]